MQEFPFANAAMSVAKMVDEYTQRGWNERGLNEFASVVEKRLRRFSPPLPSPAIVLAVNAHDELVAALEAVMDCKTASPLSMTPAERAKLWDAHAKARVALATAKATGAQP